MKTSIGFLQCGHITRSVSEGDRRISPSQALHLKCILGVMKALMLLLVLAVTVQAQTVADIARRERARQARIRSSQVITGKGTQTQTKGAQPAQTTPPAAPAAATRASNAGTPAAAPKEAAKEAQKPAGAAGRGPAPVAADPTAKWNEEVSKLRAKIQGLEDQERTLQLLVNQLTNQFFAPVTDQNSKDQAQARLGEAQNNLTAVRAELDLTKRTLDAMQLQGPPKQ
jgi:hypothetical protein